MAVVVGIEEQFLAFVKGAPETIQERLINVPVSYVNTYKKYTRQGSRVLALALKSLPDMTFSEARSLDRDMVESELIVRLSKDVPVRVTGIFKVVLARSSRVFTTPDIDPLIWLACLQAECYHYLFDASIKMHKLGFDWSSTGHGPLPSGRVCRCVNNGRAMSKETLGSSCVTKLLQSLRKSEFRNSELVCVMFDEVQEVLERWYASGIKVHIFSIYSSFSVFDEWPGLLLHCRSCRLLNLLLIGVGI